MWWILLIFSAVTLVISIALINVFIKVTAYPFYFTSILTLSIFLPLSIIFLLPIDLISSLDDNDSLFFVKNSIVLAAWKMNYWTTFALTWLVLPFLQSWFDNGQFNPRARFVSSVKEVLKFQIIIFAAGIIGLIYIISSVGFNLVAIKSLVITISHIYALILALWLMSHSLISIPKSQFLRSSISSDQLYECYMKLPKMNEELSDIKYNLKESCGKIMKLNDLKDYNVEFRDWIISLVEQVPQEYSDPLWYRGEPISNDQLTNGFMSQITKDFNYNFYRFASIKAQFDDMVDKTLDLEDIVNSKNTKVLEFRFKQTRLSPKQNYYLYNYVIPLSVKFLSVVLAGCSIIIIQSELFHSTKLSIINLIFKNKHLNTQTFENFTILIVILTYMLFAALNSLSNIRIFNIYHLSRHQSSDPVSVTFFITYAARLTIPLSYNFTMLLNNSDNAFHQFLGKSLQLISIGNILNEWLPRLILIPILLSFFNIYEKVKQFISRKFDFEFYDYFEDLEFDDFDTPENYDTAKRNSLIQAGQKILQQESSKISSGGRLAPNLRPFNIQRQRDVESHSGFLAQDRVLNRISNDNLSLSSTSNWDSIISNEESMFARIGNATSSFFSKFKRQPVNYERDNSILSENLIRQYGDLEDDDNLII